MACCDIHPECELEEVAQHEYKCEECERLEHECNTYIYVMSFGNSFECVFDTLEEALFIFKEQKKKMKYIKLTRTPMADEDEYEEYTGNTFPVEIIKEFTK